MPDRPQPGDRFVVAGRRDYLTVRDCHLAVTDDISGVTRYVVTTVHGSRWSLIARETDDGGVRWIGTALPADPKAPQP